MRKEIIIAIIIGLTIGLIVAYGVRSARLSLANHNNSLVAPTPQTANKESDSSHTIFITSPEPNSITDQDIISVIGTTSPFSLISIITNDDEVAVSADSTGTFTAKIELIGGINPISIKSYNEQGDVATTTFSVIYSTADLSATDSATIEEETDN